MAALVLAVGLTARASLHGETIADFRLVDRLEETAGVGATADLRQAGITRHGLRLLRGYEYGGDGYRAVFHVPRLDPTRLTVIADLAPSWIGPRRDGATPLGELLRNLGLPVPGRIDARNLLTLGKSGRWLGLEHHNGYLRFTLNNGDFTHEFPGRTVSPGRWHRVAVTLDTSARVARVAVDGEVLPPVVLPDTLEIQLDPDAAGELADRVVTFTHYGNGSVFLGHVARLQVLDHALDGTGLAALGAAPAGLGPPPRTPLGAWLLPASAVAAAVGIGWIAARRRGLRPPGAPAVRAKA